MASRYWVGGSGLWGDNSHWSTASGGSGGASVPTSADNVYFDANSFSATGQTVTVNVTANCLDMDWTGAINSPTLAGSSSLRVYKSLTFISAINYTHTGFIFFYGSSTGMTITSANKAFNANIGNASAEWILQDDLNCVGKDLSFYGGTLRANGKSITCNNVNSSTSSIRTLDLGTSTMTVSGNWDSTISTNFTINGGNIIMTGNSTQFKGGSATYNNLELQGNNIVIDGSNTFNELRIKTGNTVYITAGTAQEISQLSEGAADALITLQSTVSGEQFVLLSDNDITARYYSLKDCATAGSGRFAAYSSTDAGNNAGWVFYSEYSGTGFHVDSNGILQPLGVTVLRDNRIDLLPGTRDYFESVPGCDGEFDFGCDLEGQILELHCVIETTRATWYTTRNTLAGYLNPKLGTQTLTFADEPGVVYYVRYSGKIPLTQYPFAREFSIPFKMCNPYRVASSQSSLVGSGTAVNGGNDECPIIVEIVGPVTNPSVNVAGLIMTYTGQVTSSDLLVIDAEKRTALFNGVNALGNYNSVFPKLAVGDNAIIAAAGGTTTVKWHNRWL